MGTELHAAAEAILAGMKKFADAFIGEPTAELFNDNRDAICMLEHAINLKATIDPAITKAAILAQAGHLVGCSKATAFLEDELGLSRGEAIARANRATLHYPDVVESTVDASARTQAVQTAAENHISAEKQRIIADGLKKLDRDANVTTAQLHLQATQQAVERSPQDLRTWVTTAVANANSALTPDHTRAMRKRYFRLGRKDQDGGCRFEGYASGDMAALLESTIAPLAKKGQLVSNKDKDDHRTLEQRRADALHHIIRTHAEGKTERRGVGSIVVCATKEDITHAPASGYPTNTHANLNPLELLRLGAADDFVLSIDPETCAPLHLGRTQRLASVEQRLVLQAMEQVCSHPDCDQPICACDAHHLVAWAQGGYTDIENLTLLCLRHHVDNDDSKQQPHRGYASRCPDTHQVGFKALRAWCE